MNTPKRPRSHALESESRTTFESTLPDNWVYRRKDDDYGIDGEVEIFDDDGQTTGLLFFVQLKATDSENRNIQIRIETGNYYAQLEYHVLLVRYIASTNSLYGRWFERFMRPIDRRSKKTATFHMTDAHELTEARMRLLKRHLETFRALRSIQTKQFEFGVVDASTDDALPNDLIPRLLVDARTTRALIELRLKEAVIAPLQIIITAQQIRVLVCEANGFTFDLPEGYDAPTDKLAATVLAATGFAVAWHGAKREGAIMVAEHAGHSLLVDSPQGCILVGQVLHEGGQFDAAIRLVRLLAEAQSLGPDPTCVLIPFLNDPGLATCSRSILAKALQRTSLRLERDHDAVHNAAIAAYNAGNVFRGLNLHRDALRCYLRAARLRAKYLDQPYFLREIAGLAYLTGRFRISVKLYQAWVAAEPGVDIAKLLLADALLFAGEPERALAVIDETGTEMSVDDSSFKTLTQGLCTHIIETTGLMKFNRNLQSDKESQFDSALPDSQTEGLARGILDNDPLSPLAWFNLGKV